MLVDTANARWALIARMPGSQVVRKPERQRAHEREDRPADKSAFFCVCKTFCVSMCVMKVFMVLLVSADSGAVANSQCQIHPRLL